MRKITKIIIHCAYTKPSMDIGVAEIRDWHVKGNRWKDVGYHWVIRRDGQIEQGREERVVGAHVAGHNTNSIGVCLVGGKREEGLAADCNYTRHQWRALETLIGQIKARYPLAKVSGHRDFASKECPVFDAGAWFNETEMVT